MQICKLCLLLFRWLHNPVRISLRTWLLPGSSLGCDTSRASSRQNEQNERWGMSPPPPHPMPISNKTADRQQQRKWQGAREKRIVQNEKMTNKDSENEKWGNKLIIPQFTEEAGNEKCAEKESEDLIRSVLGHISCSYKCREMQRLREYWRQKMQVGTWGEVGKRVAGLCCVINQ